MAQLSARRKFGLAIKKWRQERGLTQEALSFEAGIHKTYLSAVERGQRNIALDNIVKLAKALRISVAELFNEAGL
jgi:transcriptional regulator with XRE-family HTH domain